MCTLFFQLYLFLDLRLIPFVQSVRVPLSNTSKARSSHRLLKRMAISCSSLRRYANYLKHSNSFCLRLTFCLQPHPGTCWDVSSDATLKHNGGGDSIGIASAARFAIANWGVDPNRVFAVGTSSGAMMTSVLAGAYPDVFKAGVVDSGVAFGCFSLPGQPGDTWNEQCASGQLILTGQQWAQRVFNAFPGFTGQRPKMQVWHGTA